MENITLQWEGPFSLDTPENRNQFHPKDAPGVYLWTVMQCLDHRISFRISYVGQTSSISNRIHEHISGILGGKACLFEDGQLIRGTPLDANSACYIPCLEKFLKDLDKYSQLAYKNLVSYRFFWAEMPSHGGSQGSRFRKAVETALIEYAKKKNYPLQNGTPMGSGSVSLSKENSPKIRIESNFSRAEGLSDIVPASMDYGGKQDSQIAVG